MGIIMVSPSTKYPNLPNPLIKTDNIYRSHFIATRGFY